MSEVQQSTAEQPQQSQNNQQVDDIWLKLAYIGYMLGPFFWLTGVGSVIVAAIHKGKGPQWMQSHYDFIISTFLRGLVFIIPGLILSMVIIGWFVLLFWAVWLIIRAVKGFRDLTDQKPVEQPHRWGF